MSTRRDCLADATPRTSHAGLWLDKYINEQRRDDHSSRHKLVEQVAELPVPDIYLSFYNRWTEILKDHRAWSWQAEVRGRMVIGLGAEGVAETSISLHRMYGVPYIPGSALKGLAATYARSRLQAVEWRIGGGAYAWMFGTTTEDGGITFYDALYVPGSGVKCKGQAKPLHPDVLTVHHKNYYQGENVPPADWDSPTVVPFLSATGRYLIALSGPDQWVGATLDILKGALAEIGVGAKTSSGYGRLIVISADGTTDAPVTAGIETMQPAVAPIKTAETVAPGSLERGVAPSDATVTTQRARHDAVDRDGAAVVEPVQTSEDVVTPSGTSAADIETDSAAEKTDHLHDNPPTGNQSITTTDSAGGETLGLHPQDLSADITDAAATQESGGAERPSVSSVSPPTVQEDIDTAQVGKCVRAKIHEVSSSKKGMRIRVRLLTTHGEELDFVVPYGYAQRMSFNDEAVGRLISVTILKMKPSSEGQPDSVADVGP